MNKVTAYAPKQNGRNLSHEKELVSAYSVIVTDKAGAPFELITARSWMARSRNASRVYSSLWIKSGSGGAGHGWAGGYGYHRESAAMDSAIASAGITLDRGISGVGESAIREAFEAIARYLGYPSCLVIQHA